MQSISVPTAKPTVRNVQVAEDNSIEYLMEQMAQMKKQLDNAVLNNLIGGREIKLLEQATDKTIGGDRDQEIDHWIDRGMFPLLQVVPESATVVGDMVIWREIVLPS